MPFIIASKFVVINVSAAVEKGKGTVSARRKGCHLHDFLSLREGLRGEGFKEYLVNSLKMLVPAEHCMLLKSRADFLVYYLEY